MANEARIALSPLLGAPAAVAWQPVQGARIALSPVLGAPRAVAAQPGQVRIALSPLLGSPRMIAQPLGDLWASHGLPRPDVQGYEYQSAFRIQRSLMASGVTRQRRLWAAGYRKLAATFTLLVEQLPTLHTFLDEYGYDWFPMTIVTGEPGEPQRVALYFMLDRSGSMLNEVEPGVTRLFVVCEAMKDSLVELEPRIAAGDLLLDVHVSATSGITSPTRKWNAAGATSIVLADLYDWLLDISFGVIPPLNSDYRSSEVEAPVPVSITDALDAAGNPVVTTAWASAAAAPAFFDNAPAAEKIIIILSDGGYAPPEEEIAETLLTMHAVPGVTVYAFQLGSTSYGHGLLLRLDNTPEDEVPSIAYGDYHSLKAVITKALPTRTGGVLKTVRVTADPEFSNLDTVTMSVSLQLEIR